MPIKHVSKEGLELVKRFEGCKLKAYKALPSEKYYTIGYGHYGPDVSKDMTITQSQADEMLEHDLMKFELYVLKYVTMDITQNMFNALVSLVYNIGPGNFQKSTLVKVLNNGDFLEAADEFLKWDKTNGKSLPGLTTRRVAERDMFLSNTGPLKFSKARHGQKFVSPNFKIGEFYCKDGSDEIITDVGFIRDKLQNIREHFNAPVTINSAYRTKTYNQKVGGATNSYHVKGMAYDIVVAGRTPKEVANYAKSIGCLGVIQYNTFTHIDSRTTPYYATNDNGVVRKVTSF